MHSLLDQLQAFTQAVFDNEKVVPDPTVRESGKEVLREVKTKGFAIRKDLADKNARTIFVNIQASAERKAVDDVAKATGKIFGCPAGESDKGVLQAATATGKDEVMRQAYVSLQGASEKVMVQRISATKELGRVAKSIWIIHTPMIATPCVTDGKPTPQLLAEEILKNEALSKLTLSRAEIIRDYLQAGGVLIIAYNAAEREEKRDESNKVISPGRTKEQIAIFEKLKDEFKQQIIDFPIDIHGRKAKLGLVDEKYPDDMIGATYLVEDTFGQRFEMTNRGVQANAPHNAEWGVWMQNRSQNAPEVSARMAKVFSFLQNAGLNLALDKHARIHKINPDDFAPLLSRYLSLELNPEDGMGCKIQ